MLDALNKRDDILWEDQINMKLMLNQDLMK